jgi:hypothetical protein
MLMPRRDDSFAPTIGPAVPPQNTPRIIQQRRTVLLSGDAGIPLGLMTSIVATIVSLVLLFKYQELIEFFHAVPTLLWTVRFVLVMMLATLLVRCKTRNGYDDQMRPLSYPRTQFGQRGGGIRLEGAGHNRFQNSEAALLRELQTLSTLNQQIGARQQMRDAMNARRRRAIEAREERRRQQKREQASQLVASLPRITLPNSVRSSSRPSSRASNASETAVAGVTMAPEWAQNNRPEDCSICLAQLEDEECTRLSCGHMYHHSCIESWLVDGTGQTLRCPLCNLVLLDEPELNTSDEEAQREDELAELGAGLDAALAAEWLVSAAQNAFIMQMTRDDSYDTGGVAGAQAIARRTANFNAALDSLDSLDAEERAMMEASTDSDGDDDETAIQAQTSAAPRLDDLDDIENTIQQFVQEEEARMVPDRGGGAADESVAAEATAAVAGQNDGSAGYEGNMHEPTGALGWPPSSHHRVLQPVESGPRVESTVELPDEAHRALRALAEADRAVALQTQIDMANLRTQADTAAELAERRRAIADLGMMERERTPAMANSASDGPHENPLPDGTHFV